MSVDRLLVLVLVLGLGALLLAGFIIYRRRATPAPERLDVDQLGLELMDGCCAFVVFTTSACRPCKAALEIVERAARTGRGATEVRTVDAVERSELTLRYGVRTVPTVFLITASGHVVRTWRSVPDPIEVREALAAV